MYVYCTVCVNVIDAPFTIGSLLIFYDFFYKIVFTVLPVHVTIYPGTVRVRYLHESSQFMEIRYGA